MDATQIKTRHGLILEGVTAHAIKLSGFTYRKWQYDDSAEIPDFFLPEGDVPTHVIEVHQTDARDSFRMKTLRAFTAVMEAKSHFGDALISVNILFGDPDTEVPRANLNALCGFFDVNIIPRSATSNRAAIITLEQKALEYASDEAINVEQGVKQVVQQIPQGVTELALILKRFLPGADRNEALDSLWQMERARTAKLGTSPQPGDSTYYKRALLKSIYLSDNQFAELMAQSDLNKCSSAVRQQLIATRLAEVREEVDGDYITLESSFGDYLKDPDAAHLRELCKTRLDEEQAMKWFFEDIRDDDRRLKMTSNFLDLIHKGTDELASALKDNLSNDNYLGIQHRRCWIADLTARYLGVSHNAINRLLVAKGFDPQNLGNPFNQISYKSDRFMSALDAHDDYVTGIVTVTKMFLDENAPQVAKDADELAKRLLVLRLDGALKLQKLNPLYLVLERVCQELGLNILYHSTHNYLSDLSGYRSPSEKFFTYSISRSDKKILANAVAVHDGNGDHKSKEWGARRRATFYRLRGHIIRPSEFREALFVLDGEWGNKDVQRLYRSGWTRICRLGELATTLRDIFQIKEK